MKVLLLLLLASASTVFGKSLVDSNVLIADESTEDFDVDQPNFNPTTNDYLEGEDYFGNWEAEQDANGEPSETDLDVSGDTETDEPSNDHVDQEEQDENLLTSGEWVQHHYDWNVEHRFKDSEEQDFDGYYNRYDYPRFDYPRYDYNPSGWFRQEGPVVVQPIIIPVQFALGQQDYYRRRFMY